MAYTWGEIQINSIKKMFLNNVAITTADLPMMRLDRKYATYLDAMPNTANEGLLRLMKISRPLVKEFSINYDVPDDIYDYQSFETFHVTTTDLEIEGAASKAYYFEISNDAVIKIYTVADGVDTLVQTITHIANIANTYETYKGLISNAGANEVKIVFESSDYIYDVRNIALYNINFKYEDDIYDNTKLRKFPLKTLIRDFYKINSIIFQDSDTLQEMNNVDYTLYGDSELHVDSTFKGNLILKYEAYPDKIDGSTVDTYTFTMADEMVVLLPLYIASELYKDDDAALAVQYRNQFETGLQKLNIFDEPKEFISLSGWL